MSWSLEVVLFLFYLFMLAYVSIITEASASYFSRIWGFIPLWTLCYSYRTISLIFCFIFIFYAVALRGYNYFISKMYLVALFCSILVWYTLLLLRQGYLFLLFNAFGGLAYSFRVNLSA